MVGKRVRGARKNCDPFFRKMDALGLALGYNDVRLRTQHSKVHPQKVDLATMFSRNVGLNNPIISSPMDTVTEAEMAIAMAKLGGLGILHKNLSPDEQVKAVQKIKHDLSAFISDPICVCEDQSVAAVLEMVKTKKHKFLSFPIFNRSGTVIVGIVTRRDFKFCMNPAKKIGDIMSAELIFAKAGTDISKAYKIMMERHVEILPVFGRGKELIGIYTLTDVKRIMEGKSSDYNLAPDGTLRVGAAIGVGDDARLRMELLARAKVDVVVIDTAHGDTKDMLDAIRFCKKKYPDIDVVAGNVSEPEGARALAKSGADGVRVGQGPGSICTTRIIAGVGCPQVSAVYNCARILRGSGVPVCADGGIEYPGDITIAIGVGASSVMLGKVLAGTTESPGEIVFVKGKPMKVYRGMGSLEAMADNKASRARYGQAETSAPEKLVPEGVAGKVIFKGDVSAIHHQMLGGLRAGMGYCGAATIADLQNRADFRRITPAGLKESHPHGLEEIDKTSNYEV